MSHLMMIELAMLWTVCPLVYARLCTHFEGGHHFATSQECERCTDSGAHVDHVL